ncbi:Gp37 family protein [Anabaena sp. PCC 7108]|uniref:Gp37 family protein n=1 Tax=Anabaena sp. PCC 7108 TaxID=163908 RepID=UPI00034D469C|nr:Gp37 family protein [Anabaena sp. PCC 7108]
MVDELLIDEIEKAIIERLEPLKAEKLRIEGFPDNPAELGKPVVIGQILVGYRKESLSKPSTFVASAPIIQDWTLSFELSLQLKNLRSHTGAYPIMGKIRNLLTGYKPPAIQKPLYQSEGGFVSIKEGVWYYSMIFSVSLQFVKKPWEN